MSVGEIQVKLGLDTSAFMTGLGKAKTEAMALGGSFGEIGKIFNTMGNSAGGSLGKISTLMTSIGSSTAIATAAVVALGAAAVTVGATMTKMAAEYEDAMRTVQSQTKQTDKDMQAMTQNFYQNVAKGTTMGMTQQMQAAGGLLAAGLGGSPEETSKGVMLIDRATKALGVTNDDIIRQMSMAKVLWGLNADEQEKYLSSVVATANASAASNAQVTESVSSLQRISSLLPMSADEMVALGAATTQVGISSNEVGVNWGSMLNKMSQLGEKSGAPKAFKDLGMSQEEFFTALKGGTNTLLPFMSKLKTALKDSGREAELSLQLFGTEGLRVAGNMNSIIKEFDRLHPISTQAYKDGTALGDAYATSTNTLNNNIDRISNKLLTMGTMMGGALLNPLRDASYQVDQFLGKLMNADYAGAWKGLYDSILGYNWAGAAAQIVLMVGNGLMGLASFAAQAALQLGNSLLTFDWIGAGRSIAGQIVDGFAYVKNGISDTLGNVSEWVNSGGAKSAGENLANWVINGAQAVFGAGVDLLGWLRTNLTMDKVSGIVQSAFSGLKTLASLGLQAGSDFIGGIAKAVTDAGGNYFSGISTAAGKVVGDIRQLGVDIANAGVSFLNDAANGVLAALSGKIQPLLDIVNTALGKNYQMPTSTGYTSTYKPGTITSDVGVLGSDTWQLALAVAGQSSGPSDNAKKASQLQQLGLGNLYGDPMAVMTTLAMQGVPLSQALSAANLAVQNNPVSTAALTQAYNSAQSTAYGSNVSSNLLSNGAGNGMGFGLWNASNVPGGSTSVASAASTTSAKALASSWTGGTVPVSVTNWPAGFGTGAGGTTAGGTSIAGVNSYGQTVDKNGLPVGKFDSSKINTSGPGIGMVGDTDANTPYVGIEQASLDDLAICMVDAFGMTPGLGKSLADSGAWRPNAGAASQKLAAAINYQGDYAEPSQYGSVVGSLTNATKSIATSQTATANKITGIQVGAATKATGIQIGGSYQSANTFASISQAAAQRNAQTENAAALNARVSLEDGAYSCFNAIDGGAHTFEQEMALVSAEQKATSVAVRDNIDAGGQHVKENSLSSSLDFKNTIGESATSFKDTIGSSAAAWGSTLGSGLTSLAQIASYVTGGSSASRYGGGTTSSGGIGQSSGGIGSFGGTSIGGGGGWVGTGATQSGMVEAYMNGSSYTSSNGVRWFADGGIVTKPGIVGVGEAGAEAIVPIGKLPEIMGQVMGGAGGAGHTHAIYMDGKKVADAVGGAMIKRVQQSAGMKVR